MMMIELIALRKKWIYEKRKNEPLQKVAQYLKNVNLLDEEKEKEIEMNVMKLVNEATEYAEKAPYADPEHALKYVYAER